MYPQSMLLSRNMKKSEYPCNPQFYYIKVGLKGAKLYRHVFVTNMRKKRRFRSFCVCIVSSGDLVLLIQSIVSNDSVYEQQRPEGTFLLGAGLVLNCCL